MPVYESKNLHMKSLAFGFLIFDFDQGPPCFDVCINLRKTPCPQRLKIQKPASRFINRHTKVRDLLWWTPL